MTQAAVGYDQFVNYAGFDAFKVACQEGGRPTADNLTLHSYVEETWSRGESAYVIRTPHGTYDATVNEGLGTKNLSADEMAKRLHDSFALGELGRHLEPLLGESFYNLIAQCNVAAVLNDLCTVGATPLTFLMHLAAEDASWFNNKKRWQQLIEGTRNACNLAECSWGGGETPVLKGIVQPGSALLAGSATGFISSEKRLIKPANLCASDAIILFASSGVHANGYTMLREVVTPRLPRKYLTEVPNDGRTFGEAILAPTIIYARLIQALLDAGVRIDYAVNITGHGWRKLMRAAQPFLYRIKKLPRQQPLFGLIQRYNPLSDKEMYATLCMNAGYAIFVPQNDVQLVHDICAELRRRGLPYEDTDAGCVEESDVKRLIVEPIPGVEFGPDDLKIR